MKNNKIVSFITDGILSGIMLSIGCVVNMSSDSKALGAFLFSLGLFVIIQFRMGLYTGKAGYICTREPAYIGEVALTVLGNAIGTAAGGTLLRMTRFGTSLTEKSAQLMLVKMTDNPMSIFILSVFCGILMYAAVEGNRRTAEKRDYISGLFASVLPIMVFIVCGFNHCVADMAYFSLSGFANPTPAICYFPLVMLGNALGCNIIPLLKKLTIDDTI